MSQQKIEVTREEAIKLFFKAINHDDPYWTDLVEDHLVWDGDDVIAWPSCYDVGRSLGFSDEEMETAEGLEPGRLKKLGL
jgi:hypothetical protein